jgi:hypothetical protein
MLYFHTMRPSTPHLWPALLTLNAVLALAALWPTAAAAQTTATTVPAAEATTPAAAPAQPTALPQPTPSVRVVRDEMAFTFSESMRFELNATSDRSIEDIVLRYTIGTDADASRNRRIPEFTPGQEIRAVHTEDLVRGQIPPASPITWWWALTTADGATFETEPQSTRYLDERFDWQSTDGDDVRVWWYDADRSFAEDLEMHTRAALDEIGGLIGSMPDRRIEIVAYQSQEDLRPALIDRGGTYESRLATLGARVGPDILVLDAGTRSEDLFEVLEHELSHIVMHLHLSEDYVDAPLWLDEGLAMFVEGELADDEQQILDEAIEYDELMSLRSLTSFPGQADLVPLAYAQSRDIVAFLLATYGEDKFRDLIDTIGEARVTPDEALQQVYGADQLELYQVYRASHELAPAATLVPAEAAAPRRPRSQGDTGSTGSGGSGGLCGSLGLVPLALAAMWWGRRRGAQPAA